MFFGPVTWRQKKVEAQAFPSWRLVSLKDQWDRFTAEVPAGESAVLSKRHFEEWGSLYMDTDTQSRTRSPASVKTPSGPWQDIAAAGAGDLAYDPGEAVIRNGAKIAHSSSVISPRIIVGLTFPKRPVKIDRKSVN